MEEKENNEKKILISFLPADDSIEGKKSSPCRQSWEKAKKDVSSILKAPELSPKIIGVNTRVDAHQVFEKILLRGRREKHKKRRRKFPKSWKFRFKNKKIAKLQNLNRGKLHLSTTYRLHQTWQKRMNRKTMMMNGGTFFSSNITKSESYTKCLSKQEWYARFQKQILCSSSTRKQRKCIKSWHFKYKSQVRHKRVSQDVECAVGFYLVKQTWRCEFKLRLMKQRMRTQHKDVFVVELSRNSTCFHVQHKAIRAQNQRKKHMYPKDWKFKFKDRKLERQKYSENYIKSVAVTTTAGNEKISVLWVEVESGEEGIAGVEILQQWLLQLLIVDWLHYQWKKHFVSKDWHFKYKLETWQSGKVEYSATYTQTQVWTRHIFPVEPKAIREVSNKVGRSTIASGEFQELKSLEHQVKKKLETCDEMKRLYLTFQLEDKLRLKGRGIDRFIVREGNWGNFVIRVGLLS